MANTYHTNILQAIVIGLEQIFSENKYADKVIEKLLKSNPKWGSRDRKTIAESIYEIVRYKRLYLHIAGQKDESRINYWELLAVKIWASKGELPKIKEFTNFDGALCETLFAAAQNQFVIKESIPDWMHHLVCDELGKETAETELALMNTPALVVLRANTLKTNAADLAKELTESGVEILIDNRFPDALMLAKRQNIFLLPQFKNGLFEVQDAGSQLIAPYLNLQPGMRVVDACAGAGGKALHIASIMQNKGKLIALDTEAWKLDELKKRARRAGAYNIETRIIENNKTIKRLENSADRLLLDVPCSGLGVLKRNPDAKWKLSLDFIQEIKEIQSEILNNYSKILRAGGEMVYATCSLLPSENNKQVESFIENCDGKFSLIEEKSILPSAGFDGFYMARMKKNK